MHSISKSKIGNLFSLILVLMFFSAVQLQATANNNGSTALIERFYLNILDEEITAGAMTHWQRVLNESSAKEVVLGFFSTKQFSELKLTDPQFAITLYRTVLDRSATTKEKAALQSKLDAGSSRENVLQEMLDSQEFADLLAGTRTTIVTPDEKPVVSEDAPESKDSVQEDQSGSDTSVVYANIGDGSFSYNASSKIVKVQNSSRGGMKFSHTLNETEQGTFSFNVKTIQKNADIGSIELRLIQDDKTYYKIINRDGSKTGGITKYVNGAKVDSAWFSEGYKQNENYTVRVTFTPSATMVEAFGQVLIINKDSSAVAVSSFSINTVQQNADYGNIDYSTSEAGENYAPGTANDFASVEQDSYVDVNVVANDKDMDGNLDASSVVVVKKAAHAEVSVNASGVVRYMPKSGFVGTDSFSYTVSDSFGAVSRTATVVVKVSAHTDETPVADETPAPVDNSSSTGSNTGASGVTSPYLEPINLPKCDANNPEVQFIRNKADWSSINSSSKRIFCVSPGDYRSLGSIKITASGTAAKKRYIVLNNGNNIHPAKLSKSQLANYALTLNAASYWVIDRAASFNTEIKHSFVLNKYSTHNIFNRLFTQNIYHTMWVRYRANNNTIQNSRFDGVTKRGAASDLSAINILDWNEVVEIKNTKVIGNEFVNVSPFRTARSPLTKAVRDHTAPRQHVNAEGTIFDSNTVEYGDDVRTDCNGNLDPNGLCSQVETGIGVKQGSDNPANPVIISNNHIWGFRTVDPTMTNLSGAGVGMVIYMGSKHVKVRNNVLFDGENGFRLADRYDRPYGTEYAEVTGNLLYNLGAKGKARTATPILVSQSLGDTVRDNTIINPTGKWANVWPNKNLYFGNNTVINPDDTDVIMNGGSPEGMSTNKVFKTAVQAGYTKDYTFTADKFTNSPRVITLENAVRAN